MPSTEKVPYLGTTDGYTNFSKINGSWCIEKSNFGAITIKDCKKPFVGTEPIKNSSGLITGVVVASPGDSALYLKQVKKPFKKDGYDVDEHAPAIKVEMKTDGTRAVTFDPVSRVEAAGEVQIEGEDMKTSASGKNEFKTFDFASAKSVRSTCSGAFEVKSPVTGDPKTSPGVQ